MRTSLTLCFLLVFGTANAQIVTNGGLELDTENFVTVLPGGSYGGWQSTGSGDVEFIREWVNNRNAGPAFEGEGFVDLNGVGFTGHIQQQLNTVVGEVYTIGFALSGNPGVFSDRLGTKTLQVRWNGVIAGTFAFHHTSSDTQQNLRWKQHFLLVTATGDDTLTLASTTTLYSDAGPMVDGITVDGASTTVPPGGVAIRYGGVAPNPFRGSTEIAFELGRAAGVTAEVFDLRGRKVRRLIDRRFDGGLHSVPWDGRNDLGERAAAGLYFVRLHAAGVTRVGKVLMRP